MATKKKKKSYIPLIITLALVAAAIVLIVISSLHPKGTDVKVEAPVLQDIMESIPASGKIQPVVEVKISPDVSGEIVELNYKEGDEVKKGDIVLKIKQETYISLVERAEASLNSVRAAYFQSKAQMMQAELSYKRNQKLYENKVISDAEFETATTDYKVAQEQLKAAEFNVKSGEASLKEAKEDLIKTTVSAPMSGIISRMSVEKGERVVGTSQMAGTEMFRIADFERMEVLVDVNENDIVRIVKGDTARIEVDAYPGRKFDGIVTQIANSAKNLGSTTEQVTNFEVKILILPESYQDLLEKNHTPFRPGMSSSVSIETERHPNVMTLPIQAVTTRSNAIRDSLSATAGNNDVERVFVYDGASGTVKAKIIRTGIQDLRNIEIMSGLDSSDRVVVEPYSAISKTLKDGSKVTINKDASDNVSKKKSSSQVEIQ
jgi:RND family efflux transporter, MFP subunit